MISLRLRNLHSLKHSEVEVVCFIYVTGEDSILGEILFFLYLMDQRDAFLAAFHKLFAVPEPIRYHFQVYCELLGDLSFLIY